MIKKTVKETFAKYKKEIIFLGFILMGLFGVFLNSKDIYDLGKDGIITTARIVNFKYRSHKAYNLYYTFNVNGEKIRSSTSVGFFTCEDGKDGCVGKIFNVLYSENDPENNEIDLREYNKYKLIEPSIDLRQFE